MKTRLGQWWDRLRTSYWFVPALMIAMAIAASFGTIVLDERLKGRWIEASGWIWAGSHEGARALLSAISGSMITVAGVAFSITMVVLALASSQFGPRILRNYMRDTGSQVVLGTFLATFVYCLLILRTVRGSESGEPFVPHVSVTFALLLALCSVGVLVYFIHHTSSFIQAGNVIAAVQEELAESIDHLYPDHLGKPPPGDGSLQLPDDPGDECQVVSASVSGYVQAIEIDTLLRLGKEKDLVIWVAVAPGAFVARGELIAKLGPAIRPDKKVTDKITGAFIIGRNRTPVQDAEQGLHQLSEIAVRALSPGINDPFTALICLDSLGAALRRFLERELPSPYRCDEGGRVRVVTESTNFRRMTDAAFNQIRQYGCPSVSVLIHLLETIGRIAKDAGKAEQREILRDHLDRIEQDAKQHIRNEHDLAIIQARHRTAMEILGAEMSPCRSSEVGFPASSGSVSK